MSFDLRTATAEQLRTMAVAHKGRGYTHAEWIGLMENPSDQFLAGSPAFPRASEQLVRDRISRLTPTPEKD